MAPAGRWRTVPRRGGPTPSSGEATRRRARGLIAEYERDGDGTRWSVEDRTAAGRAYAVLGEGNPEAVRAALRAFDGAGAAGSAPGAPRLPPGGPFAAN